MQGNKILLNVNHAGVLVNKMSEVSPSVVKDLCLLLLRLLLDDLRTVVAAV